MKILSEKTLNAVNDINCCNNCEIEIEDNGKDKTTVCRPFPTRFIFRLRNFFTCTKNQRDKPQQERSETMAADARHVHTSHAKEEKIHTK